MMHGTRNQNSANQYVPSKQEDETADETLYFERSRIKHLQDERVNIQKKTFTKWCNSYLNQARLEIADLFVDVCDGVMLMKLLEIISGDKLGKPNRGKMRVQKIENLNKVLGFLRKKKIQLENIGAEDILDRNERLILGLIWTIILRFQIDTITIEDEEEAGEKKHAKEALLLWCQRKTAGYHNVRIENFTTSWTNGLAFNALIHAHRPDLVRYENLSPDDHIGNLNNAFETAEKALEITKLLDAEDVDVARPDEKSIITYVSLYYHYFAKQKTEMTGARRIANIVSKLMDSERTEVDYEHIASELLQWIRVTTTQLLTVNFPSSLNGMREEHAKFNLFRTTEKPPKYKEKGYLEALFFTLQTKRKAMSRKQYVPPQGLLMHDIETAWNQLDAAENKRQQLIIKELQRQENLEKRAQQFKKKAKLRDAWLRSVMQILEGMTINSSADVQKTIKKQQAITSEVMARENRFTMLTNLCKDLCIEKYHESDNIKTIERDISDRWTALVALLNEKQRALSQLDDLTSLLRDLDTLSSELSVLEPIVCSKDVGKHILGVDDLLEKQDHTDAQISAHGSLLAKLAQAATGYIRQKGESSNMLQRKLDDVSAQYNRLLEFSRTRRQALERARTLYVFLQDYEEEMAWLAETTKICDNVVQSGDHAMMPQYSVLYKNTEMEMQSHWARCKKIINTGEKLIQAGQSVQVQPRLTSMNKAWDQLRNVVVALGSWISGAKEAQQYFQDCNEAESWMREKLTFVGSEDLGRDTETCEALLQKHSRLEEEIQAYRSEVVRLEEVSTHLATTATGITVTSQVEEVEELKVPQIEMTYKYEGNGIHVDKGEILALLEMSTAEWWRVLKQNGVEGFVPANYCRIIPNETVTVTQTTTTKKKTTESNENVFAKRQNDISHQYRSLVNKAESRRRNLLDNIKIWKFQRLCDDFVEWSRGVENILREEPDIAHIEAFRRRFDNLSADMGATGKSLLGAVADNADKLLAEGHLQSALIKKRKNEIDAQWALLNRLQNEQRNKLEACERVSDFNSICESARDWMNTKYNQLECNPTNVRSLQNLERDLKPLAEKIAHLENLAKAVRKDHPSKAQEIENQLSGLKKLYGDLVNNTQSKVALAEQLQGLEIFLSATKEVTVWIEETVKQLTSNVTAVDVDEAEDLLKKHEDLGEKIRNKQYEVDYCYELGTRLLERNKRCPEVEEPLRRLKTDMNTIQGLYDNRSDLLKQQLDLQLFNREAGRIDAITKGHEVVLEYNDLGDSVEAVESMVKRHRDLDDKLRAQEPRLDAFSKAADDLMRAKHDDSAYIDQRRKDVLQKRDKVKKLAGDRKRNLQNALEYQEWRSEMNDFINWIKEKRHALDDGNRNISSSVEQQLQKHETFAAEIYANEERKNEIDSIGAALISKGNVDKVTIERLIILENAEWKDLLNELAAKKRSLQKKGHDKALESVLKDLHIKLDELESNLKSADNGSDLRSAQKLLQDHGVLEQEINMYNANLTELEGRALSDQNKAAVTGSKDRYNIVSQLAAARKKSLQESLVWHQLCFDIDCQLLWIDEKITIARRSEKVRNLTDAVNVLKKQEQLNTEVKQHEDEVQQLVKSADQLCLASHNLSPLIRKKKEELLNSMQTLNKCMAERQKFVENAVRVQQYLSDTNELEMRMNESFELLRSEEYGNDEESARKLVTKDKTVHEDLQGYKNWLTELGNTLSEIVNKTGNEQLVDRQKDLEEKLEGLFKLAEVRQRALEDAILLHGYLRDSSELEDWINAQLQVAMSEDYAEDYEHLQELKANFEEFKQSVKTGSERFVICEETVSNILRRNPPFARDILKKQEKLRSVWTLLLDYIESREVKLGAAEELHKFNRDVFEFRQFIAEKQHNMPKDLGRNVNSVHILINKHDALEKEVKIAEKRLHALIEEANRLKQLYPGENEKHIEEEQKATIDEWEELNERLIERKNLLASACDLHGFNASIRDLLAWIDLTVSDIQSDVQINDLQQAEWLQQEHDRVNKEIAAREPECQKLVRNGEAMCSVQNYATQDIQVKTNLIKKAFFELKREWELRNDFLSQSVQWHAFARESKQIIALIGSKRTTLRSYQIGSSVTELEAHLSRLITFEKALVTVEDRISSLDQTASQLTQRNHIEKTNIEVLRQKVHDDLDVLLSDIAQQRALLMHKLQMAKFNDELNDSETWIEEKLNVFGRAKGVSGEEISNEEKMKRLQKHQAQEAEIAANQVLFDQLLKKVAEFCKFKGTDDLRSKSHLVMQKWNNLLAVSEEQYKALEEARDLLAFKQTITRLEDWINEKEVLVACKDLGRDYEHCRLLTTKLDDAKGSSIDENTLQDANRLGDKLIQQNTSEKEYVLGNLSALNKRWNALQGQIEEYRTNLRAALEVHSFNKEVDETNERIQEKILMMKNEDYGKDFASADILLRKHANLEREMSAIHKKLIHHEQEAQRLFEVQPDLQSTVVESLNKLEKSWGDLSDASKFRSTRLNEKYRLFKYFDDVKKTEVWMNQIRNRITLRRSPGNTEEAKLILDELHEIKAEIDGRQEELQKLYENGQTLIGEQPGHKAEIQRMHKRVQLVEHQLRQTWEVEKSSIQKLLEWQKWADEANQTERWLADKENLISQGDLGDNCDAVDMLIKTQIGLEKTISNYGEQVSQLMQKADALVASGNDGRSEFFERRDAITDRYASLIKKTDNRHALLNDSKRYHEFIRKCGELIIWITAKLQLAYDESFLDHTNLRSKLQKHLAFDSELTENEKRLTAVEDEGESMLQQKHFMSEQVRTQLEELRSGWEELKQKSALKSKRLRGAYDSNLLKRKLEENEEWLDKMENELSSDNHGRDLVSVEALIKKVDNLKNEISGREQNIEELVRKARAVTTSEATDEFLKHAEQLEHRYSCLKEPVEIREANLNDAKRMFIWSREAEEHFEWFGEKAHLISLNDIGENHQMLLGQQKKHAQLEKEMETRCSSIQDTCDKGLKMMGEKHFAAREIETTIHRLNADIATFKETCLLRRDLIQESMKAQEYLTDLAEVEQWIHEQMPLASSQEIGRDQMGAESNLRRLAVLEKDIETNKKEIHGLRNRADRFISEGHSFSSAIGSKQNFVEQLFNDLQAETRRRHTRLDDASKYFQFMTFADNLFDWLREREAVCCDEEYGRDLDDCVQITEKFETTVRELVSAGERVSVVQKMQEELLRSGHSYAASITAKGADIQRLWSRVNQAANERKMALGGAKQVHQFDQDADQMLNWLQEKEALEVAMEQEDLSKCDFASVKAQMERHDEFMHGMKAVEKQVADLCAEAERLCQNYPDTRPHLEVRKLDMTEQLKDILEAANSHSEKLDQLSNLQSFFQEYNEMIQWCKCMQTTITSELLPRDVLACNALTKRHDGYMIEIQGRRPQYDEFCQNGRRMITSKNVLSSEIAEKVTTLESAWRVLSEVWKDRKSLYDENMDCQQWKANANQLESWLLEKERVLGDDYKLIDSVDAADAHLRQFDDFLVTLDALDDKCELVKRLTLIEKNFTELRKKEVERVTVAQEESRRRDTIKILEKKDMLAGRRMERERRKTQEISLLINTPVVEERKMSVDNANYTLPRTDKSKKVEVLAMAKEVNEQPLEPIKVPSFNTRLNPVVKKKREDRGIIDMQGFIDRKQCLQAGGKRATIRSWKNYYAILCGQLMCFFKDEVNFKDNLASAPPLNIYGAKCEQFNEYVKRKNCFRLCTQDGADYVFVCDQESTMLEWVAKIQFHAALSPADQLTAYTSHRGGDYTMTSSTPTTTYETRVDTFDQPVNSLAYKEHTTLRFEPQLKRTVLSEATEFVSWVEEQDGKVVAPSFPSPSSSITSVNQTEENGSIKSTKRKGFSIFKRSSKANKF